MRSSQDVWFSAFLMSKGYNIIKYDVIDRGKVRCYFDIADEDWKRLKLEFNYSEVMKIKQNIEALKDLAY